MSVYNHTYAIIAQLLFSKTVDMYKFTLFKNFEIIKKIFNLYLFQPNLRQMYII